MLVLYFLIVLALPMALGAYVAVSGLQRSRRCPACGEETLPIQSRGRRLLSRLIPGTDLQLRWCANCGWEGTARIRRAPLPATRSSIRPSRSTRKDHVDIRRLDIDGRRWKVQVQCWAENGRWLGRLLFVGPDGRSCRDESASLEGDSALEVLSSALSIPEQALAGRIRRAIH